MLPLGAVGLRTVPRLSFTLLEGDNNASPLLDFCHTTLWMDDRAASAGVRFPRRHLAALSIVCASALGCYSAGLPPKPAALSGTLSGERLPWTVAIDDSGKPLPRLMQDLSRLFKHVGRLETDPNADLIITPGAPLEGEDPIPLWTLLSLGLIPTVIKEEYGHRFQLQAGRRHQHCANAPLDLDLTYSTRSVGGWLALPMNLHPNRTSRNPHNTTRFQVFLSQALLQRKQEMAKLVCGTTDSGPRH